MENRKRKGDTEMIKLLFKRLLPSLIGLAVVVLAALWLYGFVGVKAGWIGPVKVKQLNAISQHGAETAGGSVEAAKTQLGL